MIDPDKITSYSEKITTVLLDYAPKLVAALLLLFVGLYVIKMINRLVRRIMVRRSLEPTLSNFLADILNWALKMMLFVMFISKLGIETSSFVAILGAAGLAVGLSLQGSLSNFAGGVLIILFKPFKVGDVVEAQNIVGTVQEIQIFVTKVLTANNHMVFVPNGVLSNGNITNYSTTGTRRADLLLSVSYKTDIQQLRTIILQILDNDPLVLKTPAATIEIVQLTDIAIKIAIRPWAKTEDFYIVAGETLEKCLLELKSVGIDVQPSGK